MSNQQNLSSDLIVRRLRVQKSIVEMGMEACIISTSVNLFYLAGCIFSGYMYIPAVGEPIHFVKRPEGIQLDNTIYIRKPEQMGDELKNRGIDIPPKIMLETDVLPFNECNRLISSLQIKETGNASTVLRKVRSVKTSYEIQQLRHSAHIHQTVYNEIPSLYKAGMTDIELQIEIERTMRFHGSIGLFRSYGENMDIFMGSLLAGENAENPSPFDYALGGQGTNPILPLGANGQEIRYGQTIMVDMAGNYTPWMTDMTRVYSIGETAEIAYRAHQVSIDIHNMLMDVAKPGVACSELYEMAMWMVKKNKLEAYFMGTKQQARFVGHGLGLEINEPPVLTPRSKETMEANIAFALEPKFVIPEVGAVGIENTYIITETGVEKLTIFEEDIIQL